MREMTIRDLVELEDKAQFPLEHFIGKPRIVQRSFEDEKGLIAAIVVTGTTELAAIFNNRSDREKIEIMQQLPNILYRELEPKGYHDLHTFIRDPKFADILVKHFHFEDVIGRALVRRF